MTFTQAEQFLYSLTNLPRPEYMKQKQHCEDYLKRMRVFLNCLGNPEKRIPHFVHIAGTSGKGSVASFLQSILTSAGHSTGLFASPHPTHIRERWQIGNTIMNKKDFVEMVTHIKQGLDTYLKKSTYAPPSYFEITTAMGLLWFAHKNVSHVILEAGCGGRYDSTNVIPKKDIAIITNIGLDHTDILGKTKTEICKAKSGIITRRTKHILTAEKNARLRNIMQKEAQTYHKHVTYTKYNPTLESISPEGMSFIYNDVFYSLPVLGKHQMHNALLAADAARLLQVKETHILHGISTAKQPLRSEIISTQPIIIIDAAHNADKMKSTAQTLKALNLKNISLILGFSDNKNIDTMLDTLSELPVTHIACTRNTTNSFRKAANPAVIAKSCKKRFKKAKIETFIDPKDALSWTQKHTTSSNSIVITGSIFLSGELRPYLTA